MFLFLVIYEKLSFRVESKIKQEIMFHNFAICIILIVMTSLNGEASFLLDELAVSSDDVMERMSNGNVEGDSSADVFGKPSNDCFVILNLTHLIWFRDLGGVGWGGVWTNNFLNLILQEVFGWISRFPSNIFAS